MTQLRLIPLFLLTACAPKEHDGAYTHEQFWNSAVHQGHEMGSGKRHDVGHDLDCISEGRLLDHCGEDHGGMQ